jgi:hypothetical protein
MVNMKKQFQKIRRKEESHSVVMVLFRICLKGKDRKVKNRNSYLKWDFKQITSHLHALFTKGKVKRNLYWTNFPGNLCRGLLRKVWQTDL